MNPLAVVGAVVAPNAVAIVAFPGTTAAGVLAFTGGALVAGVLWKTRPAPARLDIADPTAPTAFERMDAEARADVMRDQRARDLSDIPVWNAA